MVLDAQHGYLHHNSLLERNNHLKKEELGLRKVAKMCKGISKYLLSNSYFSFSF